MTNWSDRNENLKSAHRVCRFLLMAKNKLISQPYKNRYLCQTNQFLNNN